MSSEQVYDAAMAAKELEEWYIIKNKLDDLKREEGELRKRLFGYYFPSPKEGTNTQKLPDGWALKGQHVINRKVDEAALETMRPSLEEKGIVVDNLIRWKPELNTTLYRTLSDDDRKEFDLCLTISDGSPQLTIVKPKRI